ncbi:MAG: tetratricopeptide repeat protein [Deltaproteobacteria bacterium]|nr:tetratricopeptide repeat protein [Deltaproteobacteria bacterium]
MKRIPPGEGPKFFPSFFPIFLTFFLVLIPGFFFPAPQAAAQRAEKEGLSRFDRLAQEATLLNQRGQSTKVITLLEPHQGDAKNDSALFFNELGIAYRQRGRISEAIQAYRSALSRDPENPVIMKNLGDAFYLNQEYSQGIELYQKTLQANPRFQQAHSSLGLAYYQLQRYQESLEEFEIVLQLNPQDEQAKKFREAILKKIKGQK